MATNTLTRPTTAGDETSRRTSITLHSDATPLGAAKATPLTSANTSTGALVADVEKGAPAPFDGAAIPPAPAPPAERTVRGVRWFLVCASIYLGCFIYGLDTTIAADVQAAVVETFGDVGQLAWLGTGFLMGAVATILPVGALYERFDIKYNYLVGVGLFELGSAICGAAPNATALIVGRVIAGVGGSGVYLGGLTYFSMLTTPTERGGYMAGIGIFWGIGCVVGPVIGGAFSASAATWRWGFYINLVVAALCIPVYVTMPGFQPMPGASLRTRLAGLDGLGAVLYAGAWATFTVLFTFAGTLWTWTAAPTIGLLVAFVVLLAALILQQGCALATTRARRLFPVHLLRSRGQLLLAFGTGAAVTAMFTSIFYIPLYFQFVHGDSAIDAAIRLLPFLFVSQAVNLTAGSLLARLPVHPPLYLAAGIFIVAGAAPLSRWTPDTPVAYVYGCTVLVAIGAGLVIQAGYTLATVHVVHRGRPHDIPATIAAQNVAQVGGAAVALVVSGQVFQSAAFRGLQVVLAGHGLSDDDIRAAVAGAQSGILNRLDPATQAAATAAITDALGQVWIVVLSAGVVSIAVAAMLKWERLF